MLKKIIVSLFLMVALCATAVSQKAYMPAKPSAERTAILNSLRVPVEKELKQKIQFSATHFMSNGTWAFLNGMPQNLMGETPNYSKTIYQEAIDNQMFDNNFQALLKKTKGKWKVVKYAIGCTDVCWLDWNSEFKAPKSIFPMSE